MMASAEGDLVDVEITIDGMEVLYPEKDFIVHSNHLLAERFKPIDIVGMTSPGSYLRVHRMARLIEKNYGKLTADIMKNLLADHNDYPDSICRHPDEPDPPQTHRVTRASMICVPGEQKLFVANGEPCENEYIEYKL
jgi:isopenicillin-N N-acyltransferase-like protein